MKFKGFILFALLLVMSLSAISCSEKSEKVTFKNGYPDLKGKHLVVYVSSRDEVGRALLELFKQKTGCTYEYMRMSTQEAVERVRAEKRDPKADVFIGGTCDAHALMKKERLSESYISRNYSGVQDRYKDNEGYWIGFEVEPLSIAVNKDRWDKEYANKGLQIPKTYEDLLNPVYKGEIVIPDANNSGTAYTMIASLVQSIGEKEARTLLKGIKANVGELTMTGYTPAQKVGTGEYLIAINFLGDQFLVKNSGFNIVTNVPKNCGWNIDAISKVKNGPNDSAGKYFVDFCTSKEAADALKNISFGMSTRKDTEVKNGINLNELNIYEEYNFSRASDDKNKLLEMWNSLN
ncbi:iron(III) transport system substrate-binding protein [Clostridium cavendishii DSM 21758]|uniref:Iron(III) transport system substrate-binding protein n=1 Tax=Clostridium cavendishii DSM 21758 TaxID=1121302 RepID=A0A1M6GCG2_9CLOT|nr:ABC transporter substrate-binding protein [Clostridium cavendishii]SHJ07627.1 iron(III) transport system substrate-binding protein [Clostridium cavendishii DSM 21758]